MGKKMPMIPVEMPALKVTSIESIKDNIKDAVEAFCERWVPLPELALPCEVMDMGQLRDALGLRAVSLDYGDPMPEAENQLINLGFRWHQLGNTRVMYLRERSDAVEDSGWSDAEEWEDSEMDDSFPAGELYGKVTETTYE